MTTQQVTVSAAIRQVQKPRRLKGTKMGSRVGNVMPAWSDRVARTATAIRKPAAHTKAILNASSRD